MNKFAERLVLFFLGLPLFVATVLLVPHYHYIAFQIEIVVFAVLAIMEARQILAQKMQVYPAAHLVAAGILPPLAAAASCVFGLPPVLILLAGAVSITLIFVFELAYSFSGRFEASIERLSSGFFVILYPGHLLAFLSLLTRWRHAGAIICTFFLMVFGCDSLAWLFGLLFGNGNRGILPASPNKSVAGFIGGYIGSIAGCLLGRLIWPEAFPGAAWKLIAVAACIATTAIIGDIAESILKRSAGIKDSGAVMPGRGGVLDTIDSVLLSAPVFYFLCSNLFNIQSYE